MQLQSHGLVDSVVVGSILHLGCSDVENEEALAWSNTYSCQSCQAFLSKRYQNKKTIQVTRLLKVLQNLGSLNKTKNLQAVQSGRKRQKDHRHHGCQVEELSIMHRSLGSLEVSPLKTDDEF